MTPPVGARLLAAALLLGFAGGCAKAIYAPPPLKREVLDYRLEVGDVLQIKVFNRSELTQVAPIRPDGMISMAPLGDVLAAGRTVQDLDAAISQSLAGVLTDPDVTVFVREFANQNVYVGGEVERPGVIPIQEHTTSLMAIIQAGGMSDTAQKTQVLFLRDKRGDRPNVTKINLNDILSGAVPDMVLEPYDLVFVPKSKVARANLFVEQYIRRVIPFRLVASGNYTYVDGVDKQAGAAIPP